MPIEHEALRHIPLFATLSSQDLAQIAAMTVERRYSRGDLMEDLSLRHVTARVAKRLPDQDAASREGQPVYHLTQQEMAALAGTAREVVGRALKELEATGAIQMRQGCAVILNRERPYMLASE